MSLVDDLYKAEEAAKNKEPEKRDIVGPIIEAIKNEVSESFSRREFQGYFRHNHYAEIRVNTIEDSKYSFETEKSLTAAGYTPPTFNDFIEEVTIRAKEEIGVKEFFLMLEPGIYEWIPYGQKRGLFGRNATKIHALYIYMEAKW